MVVLAPATTPRDLRPRDDAPGLRNPIMAPATRPYTLSDAALNARRNNAKRSTGPRSENGKVRSRANAVKHGLAGNGTVLIEADREALQRRLEEWEHDLRPRGPVERGLVGLAALASVRLDRGLEESETALALRRRDATTNWDKRRDRRVARLDRRMKTNPEWAQPRLESFCEGIDWLLQRWDRILERLDDGRDLDPELVASIPALLGRSSDITFRENDHVARLYADAIATLADEDLDLDALDRFFETDTRSRPSIARLDAFRNRLPDPDAARERLLEAVNAEIARLEDRFQTLWTEVDGPDRAAAPALVLIDKTPEGRLRERYEARHTSTLFRALNLLAKGRGARPWIGRDLPSRSASPPSIPEPTSQETNDVRQPIPTPPLPPIEPKTATAPNEPKTAPAPEPPKSATAPNEPKTAPAPRPTAPPQAVRSASPANPPRPTPGTAKSVLAKLKPLPKSFVSEGFATSLQPSAALVPLTMAPALDPGGTPR